MLMPGGWPGGGAWALLELADALRDISNTRDSVSSGYPNTQKRVENTGRREVFLTKFEVFR